MIALNELKAIFTDIATAIRSKTGETKALTPDQFAPTINSIEINPEKYGKVSKKTTIAVDGNTFISNILFDQNYSIESTANILKKLTYEEIAEFKPGYNETLTFNILADDNQNKLVTAVKYQYEDENTYDIVTAYLLLDIISKQIFFSSEPIVYNKEAIYGWNKEVSQINFDAVSMTKLPVTGYPDVDVGLQNNLITDIFYTDDNYIKLASNYDGSSIETQTDVNIENMLTDSKLPLNIFVKPYEVKWNPIICDGQTKPGSVLLAKPTIEETNKILSKLNYDTTYGVYFIYFYNADWGERTEILAIKKDSDYILLEITNNDFKSAKCLYTTTENYIHWDGKQLNFKFIGWNPKVIELYYDYPSKTVAQIEGNKFDVGTQNGLLLDLFYSKKTQLKIDKNYDGTPIDTEQDVNIINLMKSGKLPSKIHIPVAPTYDYADVIGVPEGNIPSNIYFNTSLSTKQVADIYYSIPSQYFDHNTPDKVYYISKHGWGNGYNLYLHKKYIERDNYCVEIILEYEDRYGNNDTAEVLFREKPISSDLFFGWNTKFLSAYKEGLDGKLISYNDIDSYYNYNQNLIDLVYCLAIPNPSYGDNYELHTINLKDKYNGCKHIFTDKPLDIVEFVEKNNEIPASIIPVTKTKPVISVKKEKSFLEDYHNAGAWVELYFDDKISVEMLENLLNPLCAADGLAGETTIDIAIPEFSLTATKIEDNKYTYKLIYTDSATNETIEFFSSENGWKKISTDEVLLRQKVKFIGGLDSKNKYRRALIDNFIIYSPDYTFISSDFAYDGSDYIIANNSNLDIKTLIAEHKLPQTIIPPQYKITSQHFKIPLTTDKYAVLSKKDYLFVSTIKFDTSKTVTDLCNIFEKCFNTTTIDKQDYKLITDLRDSDYISIDISVSDTHNFNSESDFIKIGYRSSSHYKLIFDSTVDGWIIDSVNYNETVTETSDFFANDLLSPGLMWIEDTAASTFDLTGTELTINKPTYINLIDYVKNNHEITTRIKTEYPRVTCKGKRIDPTTIDNPLKLIFNVACTDADILKIINSLVLRAQNGEFKWNKDDDGILIGDQPIGNNYSEKYLQGFLNLLTFDYEYKKTKVTLTLDITLPRVGLNATEDNPSGFNFDSNGEFIIALYNCDWNTVTPTGGWNHAYEKRTIIYNSKEPARWLKDSFTIKYTTSDISKSAGLDLNGLSDIIYETPKYIPTKQYDGKPLEITTNGEINLADYIKNGELPLTLKVNVR